MATERTGRSSETEVASVARKFAAWAETLTPAEQGTLWECLSAATSAEDEVRGYNTSPRPIFDWSLLFRLDPSLLSASSSDSGRGTRP